MPNRQPSAHDECSIKSLPRDKTEAEAGVTTTCKLCDRQFFPWPFKKCSKVSYSGGSVLREELRDILECDRFSSWCATD
jgi:hypothetical protein